MKKEVLREKAEQILEFINYDTTEKQKIDFITRELHTAFMEGRIYQLNKLK
jgi:hypothetical protein